MDHNIVAGQLDFIDTDPRKNIDTQQFIGILKQEHECQQSQKPGAARFSEQALLSLECDYKKSSLANRISGNVGTHYCLAVGNDEGLELDETDEDEELGESN